MAAHCKFIGSGASVNDGIDKELASVAYTSVDEVARRVMSLGRGAELAKADVKAAYRNVPVHPRDRWLLGMRWEGATFVDGTAVWSEVHPTDFHCPGRCNPVDCHQERSRMAQALRRRLCVGRRQRIRRMCTIDASVQRYV